MNAVPAHVPNSIEVNDNDENEAALAAAAAAAAAVATTDLLPADVRRQSSEEPHNFDHDQHHYYTAESDFDTTHQEFDHTSGMKRAISEMHGSSINVIRVNECPNKQTNKRYKHRTKFPPPSSELVVGYHENDVLCGRGATINVHPGNQVFREMCAERKPEFDVASNAEKRKIATEVVEAVMQLEPPGRFLERVESTAPIDYDVLKAATGEREKAFIGVDYYQGHERGPSASSRKMEKQLRQRLGPWRDIGIEKAVQKACGVIRDHKRPDRIALKAMGFLKKKASNTNCLDMMVSPEVAMETLTSEGTRRSSKTYTESHELVPTENDVILGRGSFINDHPGNRKFRQLALERKKRFDAGSAGDKRAISVEMYETAKACYPPVRFLKRAGHALQKPIQLPSGKGYKLPPRGLEGPWEEVSEEKAVAKACQVLRDLKVKTGETIEYVAVGEYQHNHQLEIEGSVVDLQNIHNPVTATHQYQYHENYVGNCFERCQESEEHYNIRHAGHAVGADEDFPAEPHAPIQI